jgi:hypothetical protein
MSSKIVEHMTWHQSHDAIDRMMVHPSDDKAWKHFNSVHPHFSAESKNMCLGLCIDGFNPFGSFVASYYTHSLQLATRIGIRLEFMFLFTVIPGPNNSSWNIDVCLRLLIDELMQLWSSGALTYDVSRKQNFHIRAALMWTINNFPAYGMVSGWSMQGKLACSYCMENKTFTLTNRGKMSFFLPPSSFLANKSQLQKRFLCW